MPDDITTTKVQKRVIERGEALEELLKGSHEYTLHTIRRAFYAQFRRSENDWFYLVETFADHVIVEHEQLPPDEFYRVAYARDGEGYTFAVRDQWELVELAYQVRTITESKPSKDNRLTETFTASLQLVEADGASQNPDGPWRIRAHGITADIVNGNRRRYGRHVLEAAVRRVSKHLTESAGQGRIIVSGEADHPNDKGNRTSLLTEVIINWGSVTMNGDDVLIEGWLLGTSKGKDVRAQMLGGVRPDISQRGYGKSVFTEEAGQKIEDVTELVITGYDLVVGGSDPNGRVLMFESNQQPTIEEDLPVDPKTLDELRQQYPELVAQIEAEQSDKRRKELELMLESQRRADAEVDRAKSETEANLRRELGIGDDDDLVEALKAREEERKSLAEAKAQDEEELAELRAAEQQRQVEAHITESLDSLEYPDDLKDILKTAIETQKPDTVEAVDALIEAKKVEYDAVMAQIELAAKGKTSVEVTGPVFETETGRAEFTRPAFEITERLVERQQATRRDLSKAITPNEIFTRRYLEAFDKRYRTQLEEELARYHAFMEAETTSDLNLPYSVSRAIIEEAVPELIALSIFDFDLIDTSPTRIYFENYAGETGSSPTVTDESFTSSHDAWVQLTNKRIRPSGVVVTSDPAGTTYTEFTDYVLDHANGKIMVLSTGTMADATGFLIDYTYDKVRAGENQAIQRGKGALSFQTIDAAADRLASLITDEAITFSRTQLGWDAVSRTIAMIIREIREIIDTGCIELAIASAVRSANNGGTWTAASDAVSELVEKLGLAKAAVIADYYMPTFFLLSTTNAERLSNWDGFKRDGFPDAILNRAGFVGQVKGLPVFSSNQMRDSKVLVGHPELVQHRVLSGKPMTLKGPYQAYSSGSLVAAEEYYAEEYNTTVSLIVNKGGFVTVA